MLNKYIFKKASGFLVSLQFRRIIYSHHEMTLLFVKLNSFP